MRSGSTSAFFTTSCQPLIVSLTRSFCRRDREVAEGDVARLTTLQIDRSWQPLMTIQGPASDARNFLFIDDGVTILHDGDHSSNEGDVIGLPFSRLARLFLRRGQVSVYAAGAHRRTFWLGIVFDLELVPAAQVDAAIRSWRAIEFDM